MPLLFRAGADLEDEPEPPVPIAPVAVAARPTESLKPVELDLSGRNKALFLIGPGGSGKTMLARWIAGRMHEHGQAALIAALDPQNRSLASWYEGIATPESSDSAATSRWLRQLLGHLMDEKLSGLLDFGGGDTSLLRTVANAPDLAEALQENGVEPVAVYTLTSRVDDLASLMGLERASFRPHATILVLNEGRVDDGIGPEQAFARVLRHSAFRGVVQRGGVPVWMPKMDPVVALEIEARRLHFAQARDGVVPDGRAFKPTGWTHRLEVKGWLERMERAFAPVASWLL
ncbi:MAG: hypothetical protein ACREFY_05035 [Acetobacteraceae bacterium]